MGMGYRSRRRSEYCVVVQKEPRQAKSTWLLHNIGFFAFSRKLKMTKYAVITQNKAFYKPCLINSYCEPFKKRRGNPHLKKFG